MQRLHTKASNIYDVAIVGAGLTGLSLALALQRIGKRTIVLDGGDQLGGVNLAARLDEQRFNKGLRYFPASEISNQAIDYLEGLLGSEWPRHSENNHKVAYETGEFKEFLGFGDDAPPEIDELGYFLSQDELKTELPICRWIEKLEAAYEGDRIHPAYVTRFHVKEGSVTHLTYNTNKDVFADQFVYCGSIRDMLPLFAREEIPAKIHQKVAKSTIWSTLSLDLIHGGEMPTSDRSMHVLNFGTKENPEYFVGRFERSIRVADEGEELIVSHWTALLDQEVTEDSEQVATVLKKMKKQLKKVYPEIFEKTVQERVSFVPASLGQVDLSLKDPLQLPKISNFYLGSSQLSPEQNLVAALERSLTLTRHFENTTYLEESSNAEFDAPPPQLS